MPDRVGTEIAGYRIEALIARGGMGEVYLATQSFPERKVALKLLPHDLASDQAFRERFIRESNAAASVEHPNIVPVYGAGDADGELYIAMRYVEGEDLRSLLDREGPLSPERAVHICSQIADALEEAHEHDLVHRDVKPGNILISKGDRAYLTDFGLIRRSKLETDLTKTGQFMGTVDYVAPEQIKGEEVDGRADVYSLGCVLYECLTGEPPFRRDTEVATLYAHLEDPPPKPSAKHPALPPGLDEIVQRAMAKRREDRYDSARDLVNEVRGGIVQRKARRKRNLQPRRENLRRFAVPTVVAAVLVGGLLLLTSRQGPSSPDGGPTSGPSLDAAENRLLALIPADIKASCRPVAQRPVGATATLTCTSPTGLVDMSGEPDDFRVEYSHFDNRDDMDAAFEQGLHAVQVPGGDCLTEHRARGPYTIEGSTAGQVACFRTDERSYISWTDERVLVHAVAYRNDLGDQTVYQWWLSAAGPVEGGSPLVGKDAPSAFPFIPTGTFVKTISDGSDAGRWKEVLTGQDTQGRYATFEGSSLFERGYYALGKGHEFIIWAPTGPCAGVGFGVYRFHLAEPVPGRRLLGFDFISDACGSSGSPEGTSWSHGPPFLRVS